MEEIQVHEGDITRLDVDVIVNAANEELLPGGGVCGAIHAAAGPELARACAGLGGCAPGHVRTTPAFALPAKYIVHTVGPVWCGGGEHEVETLTDCYRNSLAEATRLQARSVAFPCISTGIYGFPPPLAASTAAATLGAELARTDHSMRVVLCAFRHADAEILRAALRGN